MVKGLCSFLFYCESGINQYTAQKTLADDFGENLLGCLRIRCTTAKPFKTASSCFYEKITSF